MGKSVKQLTAPPRTRLPSRSSSRSTTSSASSPPASAACTPTSTPHLPLRLPHHRRRQRQHRRTWAIAQALAARAARCAMPSTWTQRAGGGRCAPVWRASDADVVAYMDVDLSTDLDALLPLVAPLCRATATSRSAPGWRGPRASCAAPSASSSPAATTCCCARRCGPASPTPSAASRRSAPTCARRCCRWSRTTGWFFDTELLLLAERHGLRIHEVPVDWVDDPDSRVDVVTTAMDDLRGMARVGRALATGPLPRRTCAGGWDAQPRPPPGVDRRCSASSPASRVDRRR